MRAWWAIAAVIVLLPSAYGLWAATKPAAPPAALSCADALEAYRVLGFDKQLQCPPACAQTGCLPDPQPVVVPSVPPLAPLPPVELPPLRNSTGPNLLVDIPIRESLQHFQYAFDSQGRLIFVGFRQLDWPNGEIVVGFCPDVTCQEPTLVHVPASPIHDPHLAFHIDRDDELRLLTLRVHPRPEPGPADLTVDLYDCNRNGCSRPYTVSRIDWDAGVLTAFDPEGHALVLNGDLLNRCLDDLCLEQSAGRLPSKAPLHSWAEGATRVLFRSDGRPMFIGIVVSGGSSVAHLVDCQDEACVIAADRTMMLPGLAQPHDVSFALDSLDRLVAAYLPDATYARGSPQLRLSRCLEATCTLIEEREVALVGPNKIAVRLGFDPDGRPTLLVAAWGFEDLPTTLRLLSCLDEWCAGFREVRIDAATEHEFWALDFTNDGLPRAVRGRADAEGDFWPRFFRVIVIADPVGDWGQYR